MSVAKIIERRLVQNHELNKTTKLFLISVPSDHPFALRLLMEFISLQEILVINPIMSISRETLSDQEHFVFTMPETVKVEHLVEYINSNCPQ